MPSGYRSGAAEAALAGETNVTLRPVAVTTQHDAQHLGVLQDLLLAAGARQYRNNRSLN